MEDLIKNIKEIMMNVSTGKSRIEDRNDEYQMLYKKLDEIYKEKELKNPNIFSDLWEFYNYWKNELPDYASRRDYVIKLYKQKYNNYKFDFWYYIHPKIKDICKSRFDSGHYADSVEAALKEINSIVKSIVKAKTGNEFDGSSLMKKAFSLKNPIITLDDLSTETGRNIQIGYMEIFSGSMIGIRNPKAHNNLVIDEKRAIHFIFLASLLMNKIEERKY